MVCKEEEIRGVNLWVLYFGFFLHRIESIHRRKAVVKSWFGNGKLTTVSGEIEFLQQTKYDVTNIKVSVEGLVDAGGYHIHLVSLASVISHILGSLTSFFLYCRPYSRYLSWSIWNSLARTPPYMGISILCKLIHKHRLSKELLIGMKQETSAENLDHLITRPRWWRRTMILPSRCLVCKAFWAGVLSFINKKKIVGGCVLILKEDMRHLRPENLEPLRLFIIQGALHMATWEWYAMFC